MSYQITNASRRIERFEILAAAHKEILPNKRDYRLAAEMQSSGTSIGSLDPLTTACAANREVPLITGSTRHHGYI